MNSESNIQPDGKKNDRIRGFLFALYWLCLLSSIVIILQIVHLQFFYTPNEACVEQFTPQSRKVVTKPERGAILSNDGKVLAISIPLYQVGMDCTVMKAEYLKNKDGKGEENEKKWLDKARELSKGLSEVYGDKSADEYYRMIASNRRNGRRYVRIGGLVNHEQLNKLKSYPLFNESPYRGGLIVERFDNRIYPYGSLAKRIIGNLDDKNPNNDEVGIEGMYDYALHGKDGIEWQKKTDHYAYIRDYDSTLVKVTNGKDVRTTLNLEIQDIAENALKTEMETSKNAEDIEGGCAIVLDVKTGAILAMVNLTMEQDLKARERYNYAIGRSDAPGSVFKTASLMALLDDGKVCLSDIVPTFGGKMTYNNVTLPTDPYLKRWNSDKISVKDGMRISSNQVFRYLVCKHYGNNPMRFINKLYEYKLGENFDFDLKGLAAPEIPKPGSANWSGTTLPTISYGYSIRETPLHIAMLYNGIANNGKLMKPYLVESIEKDGRVIEKKKPVVLNGAMCSEETADSLKTALRYVVTHGTGSKLKNARCSVAGKTGTARILVNFERNGKPMSAYQNDLGQKKHQGVFVGFFPAEEPKYTAIVVIYSKLSKKDFYGGGIPAAAFKKIVDNTYCITPGWEAPIKKEGKVPDMKVTKIEAGLDNLEQVPDIKGLGLKDAIYSVENCGYKCSYEGSGHVISQQPAPGTKARKGSTVRFVLK